MWLTGYFEVFFKMYVRLNKTKKKLEISKIRRLLKAPFRSRQKKKKRSFIFGLDLFITSRL